MRFLSPATFFPPPKYLLMPAVGIDISDRSFKFVELLDDLDHLRLGRYGGQIIPDGLIKSGEIINKDGLANFLRASLSGFNIGSVAISLPEEKAFVGLVTMPKMADSDVRGALELQIDEHVPLAAADVIFDYEIIPSKNDLDHLDLVLIAFPKNVVEAYNEVAKLAGFRPLIFEMEAQALARAIIPPEENDTVMIIDFGRTRSSFVIVSEKIVRFTSTVNVAGSALDEAIAKAFKVDVFEAERIKKERGLVRTKENESVFNALLPTVSVIEDEIARYLSFWKNHSQHMHRSESDNDVKRIYLTGGDVNLVGFPEYLSYQLNLPITRANPWINITEFNHYIPTISYKESLSYATALGVALRGVSFES